MSDIDKVKAAFADVLQLPSDIQYESLRYRRTNAWDSSAHMRIVARLEKELGLMLSPDDITDMESYSACLAVLRENGADV